MDYSLLTEQQLQKRFYSLPEKIRDVLNSEKNIEIVRKICQSHYLKEEKTLIVEQLIGLILLGFVSPDEMSQEISENLHLDNKHSNDIASEIDRKIFAPIRSDLEKVYAPPSEVAEQRGLNADLRGQEDDTVDLKPETEKIIKKPKETEKEKEEGDKKKKIVVEIEAPKVEKKLKEVKPEIKIETTPSILGDRTSETKNAQYLGSPISKETTTEEAPKIIHEQKKISPLTDAKKRSLGGLFGFIRKKEERGKRKKEIPAPVKATIESPFNIKEVQPPEVKRQFGEVELPKIAKTEISKPRVVHYSELKTSSPFGEIKKEERGRRKEERKEIKPPENLPIENQYKSAQNQPARQRSVCPPASSLADEVRRDPQAMAGGHKSTSEEDVIDLRTFQKMKGSTQKSEPKDE